MFFDVSFKKAGLLTIVTVVLYMVVVFSLYMVKNAPPVTHDMSDIVLRDRAELSYWLSFKLPQQALAAVDGAFFGAAPTVSAPATTTARSVPVLLYHGEGDSASAMPLGVFVGQMRALKNAGWQTITLAQFEAFMKGTGTVPDKSFLLTFDDGRTDSFYSSDPVLKDLGYTAVMFVITGFSMPGNGDSPTGNFYLSKSQLAYMKGTGRWELQSHGNEDHRTYEVPGVASTSAMFVGGQHFLSNLFWLPDKNRIETPVEYTARVTGDLTAAKDILQSSFGSPVTAFAYPFNDFGQDSENFPRSQTLLSQIVPSIYPFAFYQSAPGNGDSFNYPNPATSHIKRTEPRSAWSGANLLAALEGGRVKALPYETSNFDAAWETNWGAITSGHAQTLSLAAASSTTGAAAFLNGSESWTNYAVTASVQWNSGTFSLAARHTENTVPYVVCAFSQNKIYLERHSGPTQTTLGSALYNPPPFPASAAFSMQVQSGTATCSAYGVHVTASVPDVPAHGGIGASVWDPEPGTASTTLVHIAVAPL